MADMQKSPEIVTEQELKPVLESKAFDSATFLRLYNEWKATRDPSTFAALRKMHEDAGYNNKNIVFGAEQEMHEIAAIVQKYQDGKDKIAKDTASATAATKPGTVENEKKEPVLNTEKLKALKVDLEKEAQSPVTPAELSKTLDKLKDEKDQDSRAIITSYVWSKLNNKGYIVSIENDTISVQNQKDREGATLIEKTLQSYIKENILTMTDIQRAMMVGPTSFGKYLETQKVNPKNASTEGYIQFLTEARGIDLSKGKTPEQKIRMIQNSQATPEEKAVLISYVNGGLKNYSITPEVERQMQIAKIGEEIKASPAMKSAEKAVDTASGGGAKSEKEAMKKAGEELTWNSFVDNPMRAITKYPWTSLGLVIASIWQFGFGKTLLGLLGGFLGHNIANELGLLKYIKTNEKPAPSTSSQQPAGGPQEVVDRSYGTQFNTYLQAAFKKPDIAKERETIEKIQDINYESLRAYVMDGKEAPKGLEEVVKDKSAKSTIDTYVQYVESKNDAIATRIKIMRESDENKQAYQSMTLKQLNEKLYDTNSQFKSAISELEKAIASTNDSEEKQALQAILDTQKKAQASGNPEEVQSSLGIWDMLWNNKGKIALGVGAFFLVKKIGVLGGAMNLISGSVSLAWNTLSYSLKLIKHPVTTIKSAPADLKKVWENLGKDVPKPPKATLTEKAKGVYSNTVDLVKGGRGAADFEHMDGLKAHLEAKKIDPKILDTLKGKIEGLQKLHPGTANYLKGENELRAFLNTLDKKTVNAIRAYSDAEKFMAPEQGKFAKTLVTAIDDAKNAPIVGRSARFIISLFKRI